MYQRDFVVFLPICEGFQRGCLVFRRVFFRRLDFRRLVFRRVRVFLRDPSVFRSICFAFRRA